jgi:hypothetical protein
VRSADGAEFGIALNAAAVPELLSVACETASTSGALEIFFYSLTRRGSDSGDSRNFFCC